jgi:hypothetical protein
VRIAFCGALVTDRPRPAPAGCGGGAKTDVASQIFTKILRFRTAKSRSSGRKSAPRSTSQVASQIHGVRKHAEMLYQHKDFVATI